MSKVTKGERVATLRAVHDGINRQALHSAVRAADSLCKQEPKDARVWLKSALKDLDHADEIDVEIEEVLNGKA